MGLPSVDFGFSNSYEYLFQNKKIIKNYFCKKIINKDMSGKLQRKNEANINWKNRDALKENVYVQQFLTVQQFFIEYGLWIGTV